jgi:NAD(P)-dependent dehydrogenase (short-subunit alcohol dehydrogenase family)
MSSTIRSTNVVITGGFGALGRALAARLVAEGAQVALLDCAPVPTDGLPSGIALALGEVDLSDGISCTTAFDRIRNVLGGIDQLVNVAGGFVWESVESGTLETWDRMYAMNVRTAIASCRAALPHLLEHPAGRIVNVASMAALKAGAGMGAYAASKSGVIRLTEALSEEFKDRGITVNAVLPSTIDTPASRALMPDADRNRWVSLGKLAAVIAFLLSDDASDVTGASIPVSGRL